MTIDGAVALDVDTKGRPYATKGPVVGAGIVTSSSNGRAASILVDNVFVDAL